MARKNGPTPDDMSTSSRYGSGRAEVDDYTTARTEFDTDEVLESARMAEMEPEQESPFLRAQKRVPVRRGPLPKKAANRLKIALIVAVALIATTALILMVQRYAAKSPRFRLESSDQLQLSGNQNVTRAQIMEVLGGDISRNILGIPIEERRRQLEQIPWVESATLMRYLPNRLAVVVRERTPIAFAQVGSRIVLVDVHGVMMDMPTTGKIRYSFPVIVGFTDSEPLSTRAARMKIYSALVKDLDSGGAHYSEDLSEVDLSDPENARVTVANSGVLVHLGNSNYLDRYKVYVAHVQEWRQQFGSLKSVDLRYEGQVVVDPGTAAEGANSKGGTATTQTNPDATVPAVKPVKAAPPRSAARRARSHWKKRH